MAIQTTISLENGIIIPGAYIVIDIDKSKIRWNGLQIYFYVFANQQMRQKNIQVITGRMLINLDDENYIRYFSEEIIKDTRTSDIHQAYEYIKLQNSALDKFFDFIVDWQNIQNL